MAIRSSEKVIQISSGTIMRAALIVLAIAAFYYLRDILLNGFYKAADKFFSVLDLLKNASLISNGGNI